MLIPSNSNYLFPIFNLQMFGQPDVLLAKSFWEGNCLAKMEMDLPQMERDSCN
jgi:hypothetical protein